MSETKWVLMVAHISGGRADGRPWPNPQSGEPIEVPADEADDLIAGGMAVASSGRKAKPEKVSQDEPLVSAEPGTEAFTKTGESVGVDSNRIRTPEDFTGPGDTTTGEALADTTSHETSSSDALGGGGGGERAEQPEQAKEKTVYRADVEEAVDDLPDAAKKDTAKPKPERPAPTDLKQAWVDYAVSRGMSPDKADGMTKPELMQRYGGSSR